DFGIVANYCDRVYVMDSGEVVEEARTETLFADAAHPATQHLMAWGRRLRAGVPHLPRNTADDLDATGCLFRRKCRFAEEESGCLTAHPHLDPNARDAH